MLDINSIDFEKQAGLVPAIIQHETSGKVLMLGYMNQEALARTLETGKVWFFSRSKNRLWEKGETSGNYLYLKHISIDCDSDALLVQVLPVGPVCHRGTTGCFDEATEGEKSDFLYTLEHIIAQRASAEGEESYTRKLLSKGIDRIAQKVGEEAVEVVIASKNNDNELLKGEMADLLYHLLVLMHKKDIRLHDISEVLSLRHQAKAKTH